jgi:PIN domain nuclease of toxin-antitoxin system
MKLLLDTHIFLWYIAVIRSFLPESLKRLANQRLTLVAADAQIKAYSVSILADL